MPKNKIEDLRNELFMALEALRDEEKPLDLDRARAIADVGRVIVETAKVEVAFINATGGRGTGFMPELEAETPKPRLAATGGRRQ
jgi:hypothetical protein